MILFSLPDKRSLLSALRIVHALTPATSTALNRGRCTQLLAKNVRSNAGVGSDLALITADHHRHHLRLRRTLGHSDPCLNKLTLGTGYPDCAPHVVSVCP